MPDSMTVLSIDPSSILSPTLMIVLAIICAVVVLEAVGFAVCVLLLTWRERDRREA